MSMKDEMVKEIEKFYSRLEDLLYKKTDELFLETRHFLARKFFEKTGVSITKEEIEHYTKTEYENVKKSVLGENYLDYLNCGDDEENDCEIEECCEIEEDYEIEEFFKEKLLEFTGWYIWDDAMDEYDKYFSEYAYKSFIFRLLEENKEGLVKNLYEGYGKAYSTDYFHEVFQEWRNTGSL